MRMRARGSVWSAREWRAAGTGVAGETGDEVAASAGAGSGALSVVAGAYS